MLSLHNEPTHPRPLPRTRRARRASFAAVLGLLGCGLGLGCGSSDSGALDEPGGALSPAGVQDYGLFKSILTAGALPGPETLDQVGFFAEHKIGTPPTSCGEAVCAAAELGSMANLISGSGCTLLRLALGSPLDPRTLPRPALDVAVLAEDSALGSPLTAGLRALIGGLVDSDSVTVIGDGEVLARRATGSERDTLAGKVGTYRFGNGQAVYDRLRLALDTLGPAQPGRHRRVILLSSGAVDALSRDRAARLASAFSREGGGVTVIELGTAPGQPAPEGASQRARFLKDLADQSGGLLYHTSSTSELPELFQREVAYSLIPVATDVQLRLRSGGSWQLREVFGLNGRAVTLTAQEGTIDIPALTLAWRQQAGGSGTDRRGGGGGIFVEVLPQLQADPRARNTTVADLEVSYALPGAPGRTRQALTITSPDGPGELLPAGRFASPAVEKGFVVTNLYVALRMAAQRSATGDLSGAYSVLINVEDKATAWERSHPDPEIRDDLGYVRRFIELLEQKGARQQPPRAGWYNDPWPRD